MTHFRIAPSLLSADFARLGEEVKAVVAAGADLIDFDVMDNHYVPNLTFGAMVCQALKPYCGDILMDVHLMVEPVDDLIQSFNQAGADTFVAGSAIFGQPDYAKVMEQMRQELAKFSSI